MGYTSDGDLAGVLGRRTAQSCGDAATNSVGANYCGAFHVVSTPGELDFYV
jgi:hypothetical protein